MSNSNNQTDYYLWSRHLTRSIFKVASLVKQWLSSVSFIVVVIAFAVLFYKAINTSLVADNQPRNIQPLVSKPKKDIGTSTPNIQNEVTDDLDQVTLKEKIPKIDHDEHLLESTKKDELIVPAIDDVPALKSHLSIDPINSISVEPDTNKAIQKVEKGNNNKAKDAQNAQIDKIIKQIATDKVIIPKSVANARTPTAKSIKTVNIENKPELTTESSQSSMGLILPSKPKPLDTEDIQSIYQKDLDRLSNDDELKKLFKNNHSKDLKSIEI